MSQERYKKHLEMCHSEEWRQKVSLASKGKKKTQEWVDNMKKSLKNQKKYKCPYCGIETIRGNYKRWHGNNCKKKHHEQENH